MKSRVNFDKELPSDPQSSQYKAYAVAKNRRLVLKAKSLQRLYDPLKLSTSIINYLYSTPYFIAEN